MVADYDEPPDKALLEMEEDAKAIQAVVAVLQAFKSETRRRAIRVIADKFGVLKYE